MIFSASAPDCMVIFDTKVGLGTANDSQSIRVHVSMYPLIHRFESRDSSGKCSALARVVNAEQRHKHETYINN